MAYERRLIVVLATIGLGAAGWSTPAPAQTGDAHRGHALAQSWCASCHIIDDRGSGRAVDMAPTFPVLAADPGMTPERLQAAMTGKHTRMPDFNLGRRDTADLAAYIRSLKPPPEQKR